MMPLITIITPTFKRDTATIRRCIESVNGQSYTNWEHIIVSDTSNKEESVISILNDMPNNNKRKYYWNETGPYETWGAYPRQIGMDKCNPESRYYVFLDDDNILFPHHLRVMVENIGTALASICTIYHHGPLNRAILPSVDAMVKNDLVYKLKGTPPKLYSIDTLNIMVDKPTMDRCGWIYKTKEDGYCNDGFTYDKLFTEHIKENWIAIDDILAAHF